MLCAIAVGAVLSSGLGEQPVSFGSFLRCGSGVRFQVVGDTSNKLESGAGWIAGGDLDYRPLRGGWSPIVGLGYRYRNGGAWVKESVWGRVGVAAGPARLVLAQDVSTRNRTTMLGLEVPVPVAGRVGLEMSASAARFYQNDAPAWGVLTSISVVLR